MKEHDVFLAAVEINDPEQRETYLASACTGDPELRRQVDSLLAAHEQSGEFLNVPVLQQMGGEPALHALGETSIVPASAADEIDLSFLQPSAVPDSLGRLLHYEIMHFIGRGGCGMVFKAFDEKLERTVAIKVMLPELAATSPARKRFLREARATAAIRHENVVGIHAVEEQPLPFLAMEYIAGETLQHRLDRTGPLDVRDVLRIGQQISSGLGAAHGKGLIHRDIKPSNILLEDETGKLKVTDFGLARSADDASMTQSGMIAGTPLYMSPEQTHGRSIDHRSDLFSLGSVLYVMCTGRPPFRASSALAVMKRVAEEQPRPIHDIIPEVPTWLIAIIARLHAKAPEDRFSSAQEVGTLLARCLYELEQHGRVELPEDMLAMLSHPRGEEVEHAHGTRSTAEELVVPATVNQPARLRGRNWWVAAAIVLVPLVVMSVTEATGVTNVGGPVIRLFSPEGTLVVQVDDPDVSVTIDGEEMIITGTGAREIRLKPGQYKVLANKDGNVVRRELVTVTNNGRIVVRVSRESAAPPDTQARADEAGTLLANDQAEEIRREFRRLNPDFKGEITFLVDDGRVVRWSIADGKLANLSPLLALEHLEQLNYAAFDPERDAPVVRKLTNLEKINGDSAASYRLAYPANKPPSGVSGEWLDAVAKLPLKSRVSVVMEKLQEQNPNFDGKYQFHDADMSLKFSSRAVTDLSPLKALPELRELACSVSLPDRSWLADLSPLRDIPLTSLECWHTQVSDLAPLRGKPLTTLIVGGTSVSDLAPLKDMPLTLLNISGTQVEDLGDLSDMKLQSLVCNSTKIADLIPLAGMPLAELGCDRTAISDLSPLKGAPLQHLSCWNTQVSDLSPLEGMPLKELWCKGTRVSDLSPLKGMPLNVLSCSNTQVADVSPLAGMPLESLWIPDVSAENLQFIRGIQSLKQINGKPAAAFWKVTQAP